MLEIFEDLNGSYFEDKNGNRSYFKYFGGKVKAKKAILSLKDCEKCVNCKELEPCNICYNCDFCIKNIVKTSCNCEKD